MFSFRQIDGSVTGEMTLGGDEMAEGTSAADSARLRAVPKVELHLHLEGAIPHDALFSLIQKYGGDPAVRGAADIAARFRFRDFPHFIAMWLWKNGFLRAYDDFSLIAEAMAHELVAENVKYAEVFFSRRPVSSPRVWNRRR